MDMPLYRLVYASRATFKPYTTENTIDSNIAKILQVARRDNQKRNLVGALYYGNGCFFQCLEGTKQAIDVLYEKLLQDSRHKDLKVLSMTPIANVSFSSWEMKYATIDHEVRQFLRQQEIKKFDPYRFSEKTVSELVGMLQSADDAVNVESLRLAAESVPPQDNRLSYAVLIGMLMAFFGYMFVQM